MSIPGDVRVGGKLTAAGGVPARASPAARPEAAPEPGPRLSLAARILLWDFDRGSLAYDLLCLFLLLFLLLVPAAWWGDPMVVRR